MSETKIISNGEKKDFKTLDETKLKAIDESLICFNIEGEPIFKVDLDGIEYKGKRIEDAGEAHRAFIKTMELMDKANS